MTISSFQIGTSGWYILLCIVIAAGYTWLLYGRSVIWKRWVHVTLSVLRFVVVFFLCFYLLNPFFKYIHAQVHKPLIVLAVDNSQSVSLGSGDMAMEKINTAVTQLQKNLPAEGFEVQLHTFSSPSRNPVSFTNPSSPITDLLENVQNTYDNQNLHATLLFSDGIYNQGVSPLYASVSKKIYTVGLGDTIPRKDVRIESILSNKVAFWGNNFPLKATLRAQGYKGQSLKLQLKKGTTLVAQQTVRLSENNGIAVANFELKAEEKGVQSYTLTSEPLKGEFTLKNNSRTVYIDVIDGKENVLLVSKAPHPDIKAIRAALERKENVAFEVYIPGITELKDKNYDLIILHQVTLSDVPSVKKITTPATSLWYIVGRQSDLTPFNNENGLVQVQAMSTARDVVTSVPNEQFARYQISTDQATHFSKFPPVEVPYGEYRLFPQAEIVLYQKVGSVTTQKPLMAIGWGEKRSAVLFSENTWQWRLQEYADYENTEATDELITKTVQFLSSKDDKRKFRAYPVNPQFSEAETIFLETEAYNDLYEKVYGQKITVRITGPGSKPISYTYTTSPSGTQLAISPLPAGVYKVKATTQLNGREETSFSQFVVEEQYLETQELTANHVLLRQLAVQSGGTYVHFSDVQNLLPLLKKDNPKNLLTSEEDSKNLIDFKIFFFLVLFLISSEWFLRKYMGGY